MSIPKPETEQSSAEVKAPSSRYQFLRYLRMINPFGARAPSSKDTLTFANNYFIMTLGWAIFIVVCIADVYALVGLAALVLAVQVVAVRS